MSTSIKRFCEEHAPEGAVDIVQRACVSCGLLDILSAQRLCSSCDPESRARAEHAKELAVKAFLDVRAAAGGPRYLQHDRVVDNAACVRYRPDFLFDCGSHAVVLEVDEHQHASYACECEQARMVNLAQALGYPTVFVRFNPDAYRAPAGRKAYSKKQRHDVLARWLDHLVLPEGSPATRGRFSEALYLFYDGFDAASALPIAIEAMQSE